MKNFAFIVLLNLSAQAFAFDVLPTACFKKSAVAASQFAGPGRYDKNGFKAFECTLAPNKAVILCNVAASKGNGAAFDTFRVVLNLNCARAWRVDLTGEE